MFLISKADICNPLSLLAQERSRFVTCQWELLTPTEHPPYPPLSALHTSIGGMLILRSYKVFLMTAHLYLFARYISLYVKNYYCFRYFTEQPSRWLYFIKLFVVFTCPFWHKKVPISANIETGINYYLLFSEN